MKDFTKTQKPKPETQGRTGALKCNVCNTIVNAFGVQPGDACIGPDKVPQNDGAFAGRATCRGKYLKFDDQAADALKRKTDGNA